MSEDKHPLIKKIDEIVDALKHAPRPDDIVEPCVNAGEVTYRQRNFTEREQDRSTDASENKDIGGRS